MTQTRKSRPRGWAGSLGKGIAAPSVQPVAVTGYVYSPHQRRRRYLVLVESCPFCQAAHEHYTNRVGQNLKRCCLVSGERYVVFPRVRRAVRRGQ